MSDLAEEAMLHYYIETGELPEGKGWSTEDIALESIRKVLSSAEHSKLPTSEMQARWDNLNRRRAGIAQLIAPVTEEPVEGFPTQRLPDIPFNPEDLGPLAKILRDLPK